MKKSKKCAEKTVIQELLVKIQGERLFEKPVKNKEKHKKNNEKLIKNQEKPVKPTKNIFS